MLLGGVSGGGGSSAAPAQSVQICYALGTTRVTVVTLAKAAGVTTYYFQNGSQVADPVQIAWLEEQIALATADKVEDCSQEEINNLKKYVDQQDAQTLTSAQSYADQRDSAVLSQAQATADNLAQGYAADAVVAANQHSDANDTTTLNTAKSYTDSKTAQALADAKAYTDSKASATRRVVTIASGTTLPINLDTTDTAIQVNTAASNLGITVSTTGTTPTTERKMEVLITSTVSQTLTWGSMFVGSSDLQLPSTTTGSNKHDRLGFTYHAASNKWHLVGKVFGF